MQIYRDNALALKKKDIKKGGWYLGYARAVARYITAEFTAGVIYLGHSSEDRERILHLSSGCKIASLTEINANFESITDANEADYYYDALTEYSGRMSCVCGRFKNVRIARNADSDSMYEVSRY